MKGKEKIMTMGKKYKYDDIKKEFNNKGYILVSTEYRNIQSELQYICKKHENRGVQKIRYSNFIRGRYCSYCMYENGTPPEILPEPIYREATEANGYKYIGKYSKNGYTRINYICLKHEELGVQDSLWTSIKQKKKCCKYCNPNFKTPEKFNEQIKNIFDGNIKILGKYKNAKEKIECLCIIHNYTWKSSPSNLLSGYGCYLCGREKVKQGRLIPVHRKREILESRNKEIEYLIVPDKSGDYVSCKCKKCGNLWQATYSNLVKEKNTRCPNCYSSIGEKRIKELLDLWGIEYISQKTFADCKDVHVLPFDFYLPQYNILIEFDGEQHYHPIPRGKNSDGTKDYEILTKHDKIKTDYCIKNNIKLIRIPYWERYNEKEVLLSYFKKNNIIIFPES